MDNERKNIQYRPLTAKEIRDTANERVHLISKEFTDAFNFLAKYPKSVTIFGGLRFTEEDHYYMKAESLARRIVTDLRYAVFTGGSVGIMEAANKGAYEAHGKSVGLTIELPHKQPNNRYQTAHLDFYYFFSRKVALAFSAEAYVFFPGGYGTLNEFFEIITLVQTGKIEKVPVILVGTDFWKPLNDLLRKELLSRGTIDEQDLSLYTITDEEEHIIDIIRHAPFHNGIKFTHHDMQNEGMVIEPQKV